MLWRCTPDFDALESGDGAGGSAGCAGASCGGSSGESGGSSAGGAKGGKTSGGAGGTSHAGESPGGMAGESSGGASGGVPSSSGGTTPGSGGSVVVVSGGTIGETGGSGPTAGEAGAGGVGGSGPVKCTSSSPKGALLYSFEDATLSGNTGLSGGWITYVEGAGLSSAEIKWNETEGKSCPGALSLGVPFSVYQDPNRVMAVINFNEDWTGKLVLHASIKVLEPTTGPISYLLGLQFSVSSGGNYEAFRGSFLNAALFTDRAWHDVSIPLNAKDPTTGDNAYVPGQVRQIGMQVASAAAKPSGAPDAPLPTTVLIDDIWIE
ncbi:MAG: hypothetical protein QM756_14675 [Polyangiaceae bacterium]